jgi:hypothetical protein
MKLSILILTQFSRCYFLERLLSVLEPQVASAPEVEMLIRYDDKHLSLGENRQLLRESASGKYSCFIDDDDLVSESYVRSILPLLDEVDYIGFQVQLYEDGSKSKPTYHSLQYSSWHEDDLGYYRDISHLNPIKTSIAIQVRMDGNAGEDSRWADKIRSSELVKTQHYIDAILYEYYWRSDKEDGAIND